MQHIISYLGNGDMIVLISTLARRVKIHDVSSHAFSDCQSTWLHGNRDDAVPCLVPNRRQTPLGLQPLVFLRRSYGPRLPNAPNFGGDSKTAQSRVSLWDDDFTLCSAPKSPEPPGRSSEPARSPRQAPVAHASVSRRRPGIVPHYSNCGIPGPNP